MNAQKKIIFQPKKQNITYGYNKPDIYLRVEKERERQKKIKKFTRKNELKIIYKYWILLKRHYLFKQMVKRQKLNLVSIAFGLLKYYYLTNYQKYGNIIEHFDLRKKGMIFYMLYNEHIIKSKKRFLISQKIITTIDTFLNTTRNQIQKKYNNYGLNQKFYFNIFINQIFSLIRENGRINQSTALITNFQMNNAYFSIIKFLRRKNYIEKKLDIMPRMQSYSYFFRIIKEKISKKFEKSKKIFDFRLKFAYRSFNKQMKKSFKERNKNIFVQQFYEEKLQRKVFTKIKAHLIIVNNFRRMVVNKYFMEKERIKEKTEPEYHKKYSLIQKYREYKQKKLIPIKKIFFSNTKKIIERKKMNVFARKSAIKSLKKKIFIGFGKYTVKNKLFKIFLIKFQKIYRYNIKKEYIHLMQYKVHKFLGPWEEYDNYLPHLVGYYITQKFNEQLISLKIYEMKSFIKKCRKIIINKKKEKNKSLAADIFYSKLLKIKVFEKFNSYSKYIKIKKMYKKDIQIKYLSALKLSMDLSKKENILKNKKKVTGKKSLYQKFFIGLMIWGGKNVYNHRKASMRNIIINQILKNEELNNTMNNFKENKDSINDKLATLILFKLIIFIIYRKLFNNLKVILLNNRFKNSIIKKYLKGLYQAKINNNQIKTKMNIIKDDVLNINK